MVSISQEPEKTGPCQPKEALLWRYISLGYTLCCISNPLLASRLLQTLLTQCSKPRLVFCSVSSPLCQLTGCCTSLATLFQIHSLKTGFTPSRPALLIWLLPRRVLIMSSLLLLFAYIWCQKTQEGNNKSLFPRGQPSPNRTKLPIWH